MPAAAIAATGAGRVLPLDEIAEPLGALPRPSEGPS